MILERTKKAVSTIIELFSLSKEANLGKHQISNQIMLCKTVFLLRLLYNCEIWTNLSDNDYSNLQKVQLNYLRRIMEVPRSTPIHGTFLELGILPIPCEIEERQLCYLRQILVKDEHDPDPILKVYKEMFKYNTERNWGKWADMVTCLLKSMTSP